MSNRKKTFIFIICYLAYTAIYINRLNLSIASPALIETSILNKAQVGMIGSIFSIVFSIGRLVNGYISDRKSPRFMLVTGLLAVSLSNIVIGAVPSFGSMLVLWSINAYAQSMLWSSLLRIIATTYEPEVAKKKTSVLVTSVAVGNIAGIVLNTMLVNYLGMRYAFIVPGITTLILGFLIFVFVPKFESEENIDEEKNISFITLLKDRRIKKILIPTMCHGVMKDNISLWMTVYFVDTYKINLTASAGFILFIPIIGFIGRLSYLFFSKLCNYNEQKLAAYCFAVCTAASIVLCMGGISTYTALFCLSLIYAAVSVANTSFVSIFPLRFTDSGNVAFVSGMMDFVTYAGAGISSCVYGILIEKLGYSSMYFTWVIISIISIFILYKFKSDAKSKSFNL